MAISANVHASEARSMKMDISRTENSFWLEIKDRKGGYDYAAIFLDPRLEPQVRALVEAHEALNVAPAPSELVSEAEAEEPWL